MNRRQEATKIGNRNSCQSCAKARVNYSENIIPTFYKGFKEKRDFLIEYIDMPQKDTVAQDIFNMIFFIYFLCDAGIIRDVNRKKITGNKLFSEILLGHGDFWDNLRRLFIYSRTTNENIVEIGTYRLNIPCRLFSLFKIPESIDILIPNKIWGDIIGFFNNFQWRIRYNKIKDKYILTPEILGEIYELYIAGKISGSHSSSGCCRKISKRKKNGIYYTPEPITEYICKNTIIPYLMENLDKKYDSIESLIDTQNIYDIEKAIEILDKLKLLDPACGAGNFLINAAEMLYQLKKRLYYRLGREVDPYILKHHIINENIYGVDIIDTAIEIAKMRLFFWHIKEYDELKHPIGSLSGLKYNLRPGNSLIGWVDEDILEIGIDKPLKDKIAEIISYIENLSIQNSSESAEKRESPLKKLINIYIRIPEIPQENQSSRIAEEIQALRKQIHSLIDSIYLDYINKRFQVNKTRYYLENEEFSRLKPFHWGIEFGDVMRAGGFHIIIGNPPYGNILSSVEKNILKFALEFSVIRSDINGRGTKNVAGIFLERIYHLIAENGYAGFIIPKSSLYVSEWEKLRLMLLNKVNLIRVVDNGKAFGDVLLEMATLIFKKTTIIEDEVIVHNFYLHDYKKYSSNPYNVPRRYMSSNRFITELNEIKEDIYNKIIENSISLGRIAINYRGLPVNSMVRCKWEKDSVEILRGSSIQRNYLRGCCYIDKKIVSKYRFKPAHLQFQEILAHIKSPLPHIKITGVYLEKPLLNLNTVTNIYLTDQGFAEKYILALLHSRLLNWFAYRYIYVNSIRTMHFSGRYLDSLPILNISPREQKYFITTIDKIISVLTHNPVEATQKIKKYYSLIDRRIYKYYDLSKDEIEVIESETPTIFS